jgi:hypothetical protein
VDELKATPLSLSSRKNGLVVEFEPYSPIPVSVREIDPV